LSRPKHTRVAMPTEEEDKEFEVSICKKIKAIQTKLIKFIS
jgi:hypothetical protein